MKRTHLTNSLLSACLCAGALHADDSLINPCYGPDKHEFFSETNITRAFLRYRNYKVDYNVVWQGFYYGLGEEWTLCVGGAEYWYKHRIYFDGGSLRFHLRDQGLFTGVWYYHTFGDNDAYGLEGYYNTIRSIGISTEASYTLNTYYCHRFESVGITTQLRFMMDAPASRGRYNDPVYHYELAAYAKLGESTGLQWQLYAEHESSTGQVCAAYSCVSIGYQFNDHLGVIFGITNMLHDWGKTWHGIPYLPMDRGMGFNTSIRILF